MRFDFDSLLQHHLSHDRSTVTVGQIYFIYTFSVIGLITIFGFGAYNTVFGKFSLGIMEILLGCIHLFNLYYYYRHNNFTIITNILFGLMIALVLMLIVTGGMANTGIYWLFIVPPLFFFIANRHTVLWILFLFGVLFSMTILSAMEMIELPYTYIQLRQAFFAFLVLNLMIYFYHRIIIKQNTNLTSVNDRLHEQQHMLTRASEAKSQFLANMSHEIRTPLNAILGFIDLLKENESDPKNLSYIETIQKSSSVLLSIINDILDLSKIESGNLTLESVAFQPRREFKAMISIFMAKAYEKQVTMHTLIDPALPPCITSDPLRLKQVISNLLSNAIKFTPSGGSIVLSIQYQESPAALHVSVKDTGIGIKAEDFEKILTPFSQADDSTTREFGGSGLGLSICNRLVSMLGGTLNITSSPGEGSLFSFEIPLESCETCLVNYNNVHEKRLKKVQNGNTPAPRFDGRVLIVEDNEMNQMFMQVLLDQFGLNYDIAVNGIEAVEHFEAHAYDLILMDENMPRMNGSEATRRIRNLETEKQLPHTPIIALTANALQGDEERFLSAGMDAYLSKPVDKKKLSELFQHFLG